MSEFSNRSGVVPAQLSFLAIYNPSLGSNDGTLHDQVVFYSSKASRARSGRKTNNEGGDQEQHEEENEKLRQIGLAQGMVEFAKSFSNGEAVDSVETEKSRIVLHELERGWWILASIDLTRLPSSSLNELQSFKTSSSAPVENIEYSAREVCPPTLLLQQLLRAHRIFLLHHGPSLSELYERTPRAKFCSVLNRFWTRFAWNWEVMLNGNPAVDIFNGMKVAAGGELGIGVGEEDWGSGEREVLEGFVERTEGLIDLVVSRFGEPAAEVVNSSKSPNNASRTPNAKSDSRQWLGTGTVPGPLDGVVFSGVGAITRSSLRDVSDWTQWLYAFGEDAYGVHENPNSAHRRKRRRVQLEGPNNRATRENNHAPVPLENLAQGSSRHGKQELSVNKERQEGVPVGIPPPIVSAAEQSLSKATTSATTIRDRSRTRNPGENKSSVERGNSTSSTDTLMKYLTLGVYGSSWGLSSARPAAQRRGSVNSQKTTSVNPADGQEEPAMKHIDPKAEDPPEEDRGSTPGMANSNCKFVIGLQGNLKEDDAEEDNAETVESGTDHEVWSWDSNSRILIRTLHAELTKPKFVDRDADEHNQSLANLKESHSTSRERLRVVVYVHQPFIFTFLFDLHTDSLAMPSFYRSLHHQLSPIHKSLLTSTSPAKVSERLQNAFIPRSTSSNSNGEAIYDLLYDPSNLTIHTSVPNIPEPGTAAAEGLDLIASPWSRIEALNVHTQILNTYISTRRHSSELERTCKTSRGWWVVWMRLPHPPTKSETHSNVYREAFLVRRASDSAVAGSKKLSGRLGLDGRGSTGGSGWGPSKLAEGIGIDTRRYIEGLLSLNR